MRGGGVGGQFKDMNRREGESGSFCPPDGLAFRPVGKYARLSLTLVQKNGYNLCAIKRHYLTYYM